MRKIDREKEAREWVNRNRGKWMQYNGVLTLIVMPIEYARKDSDGDHAFNCLCYEPSSGNGYDLFQSTKYLLSNYKDFNWIDLTDTEASEFMERFKEHPLVSTYRLKIEIDDYFRGAE